MEIKQTTTIKKLSYLQKIKQYKEKIFLFSLEVQSLVVWNAKYLYHVKNNRFKCI